MWGISGKYFCHTMYNKMAMLKNIIITWKYKIKTKVIPRKVLYLII